MQVMRKIVVKDIAKQLCMHERTLNRRLREEGTTFRRELETIRNDLARQMLVNSSLPISRIAESLGYADPTALSRAFKQWSGLTPTEWRARNRCGVRAREIEID